MITSPPRAPLQPVTPTDANARDDDGDRLPSVDADPKAVDPKPKVRKLVMPKHANPAPQTPAKPMAKPADETADEAADEAAVRGQGVAGQQPHLKPRAPAPRRETTTTLLANTARRRMRALRACV